MATTHELWETRSNNVIGTYVTEGAALAAVSAQVTRYGREAVESWTLLRETEDGEVDLLAGAQDLVELARRYSAQQVPAAFPRRE